MGANLTDLQIYVRDYGVFPLIETETDTEADLHLCVVHTAPRLRRTPKSLGTIPILSVSATVSVTAPLLRHLYNIRS